MLRLITAIGIGLLAATSVSAQSTFPQVNIDIGCEEWARRADPSVPDLKARCVRLQAEYRAAVLAIWPSTAESVRATCAQSAVRENSYTALAQCIMNQSRAP